MELQTLCNVFPAAKTEQNKYFCMENYWVIHQFTPIRVQIKRETMIISS